MQRSNANFLVYCRLFDFAKFLGFDPPDQKIKNRDELTDFFNKHKKIEIAANSIDKSSPFSKIFIILYCDKITNTKTLSDETEKHSSSKIYVVSSSPKQNILFDKKNNQIFILNKRNFIIYFPLNVFYIENFKLNKNSPEIIALFKTQNIDSSLLPKLSVTDMHSIWRGCVPGDILGFDFPSDNSIIKKIYYLII
jgi:hypothetical protein